VSYTASILAVLIPAVIAAVVDRRLANPESRWFIGDKPNERSMHTGIIARTGGVGLLAGALPVAMWASLREAAGGFSVALASTVLLAAVSLIDDRQGLPARVRLAVHLGAATIALLALGVPWAWLLPAALAVGWFINLYNFMDGLDGLAGGAAVAGFSGYAVVAWLSGDTELALASAAFVGGALGFLTLNWPPARIFLGDVGSTALGFTAAVIGVAGALRGVWPWWYPLAAFPMFVGDASVTLLRRALRREVLWQAHRSHLYQRAALAGLPKTIVAIIYGGVALLCSLGTAALLTSGAGRASMLVLLLPAAVWAAMQLYAARHGQP
jgi:UDP-N-acetylmuramyl pentapeptide phosphotransferase/UDP-N-acetylglucosamine-1-phosphate transferase